MKKKVLVGYKVLTLDYSATETLSNWVLELAADGWEPLGGISMDTSFSKIAQAMVKYSEK